MKFSDKLEELRDAAALSDDELGEYWNIICLAYDSCKHSGSDFLKKALEKEISSEYNRLKQEFEIVETEHTSTVIIKTLEMKS